MNSALITLALALFACLALGQDINAFVTYKNKIYAFDGLDWLEDGTGFVPHAYEINTTGVQTNKFVLPIANQGAIQLSSFVNGNTLYQFSGAYGDATLSKYALPLTNPVTAIASVELPNQVQGIPAVLSVKDGFAIVLCSRYLTVVSLSNLTITSSLLVVSGSGKTPGSLVYNAQTNKVYYFQRNYCFAGYCQHIYVYKVSAQGILSVSSDSDSFTPDYTTSFNNGELSGCAINSKTNTIWCINHVTNQLFEVSMNNLNNYTLFATPGGNLAKGQVTFDFTAGRAFFTSAHATSYSVYELDLAGHVVGAIVVHANPSATITFAGAPNSLFIGNKFANGTRQATLMRLDPKGNNNEAVNAKVINLI